MTTWPRITIVTPNFNGSATLRATLDSVLGQDYPDLEYIVMDAGSTDGSVAVIREYADQLAYWSSKPDLGQSDALNQAFSRATGELWTFVNSDDRLAPGALHALADAWLNNGRPDVIHGHCALQDAEGRKLGVIRPRIRKLADLLDLHRFWWKHGQFVQPEVLFTAEIARRTGPFNLNVTLAFDFEYWLRVFALKPRVHAIDAVTAIHVRHPGQKTADAKLVSDDVTRIAIDWLRDSGHPPRGLTRRRLLADLEFQYIHQPALSTLPTRGARWLRAAELVLGNPCLLLTRGWWRRILGSLPEQSNA